MAAKLGRLTGEEEGAGNGRGEILLSLEPPHREIAVSSAGMRIAAPVMKIRSGELRIDARAIDTERTRERVESGREHRVVVERHQLLRGRTSRPAGEDRATNGEPAPPRRKGAIARVKEEHLFERSIPLRVDEPGILPEPRAEMEHDLHHRSHPDAG